MIDSSCAVSATRTRAARMAGDTCTRLTACDFAKSARRSRIRDAVVLATVIERYAPDPAAATPSRSSRKPTMIRSGVKRRGERGTEFDDRLRDAAREKFAPKKYPAPPT